MIVDGIEHASPNALVDWHHEQCTSPGSRLCKKTKGRVGSDFENRAGGWLLFQAWNFLAQVST